MLPEEVMSLYELEGAELEVDLESTEFEGVGIDYYNFIRIVEPDQYGGLPLRDFGGWFEIRNEGVYLKLPDERVLACLTTLERDDLLRHPKGRPYEPVLAFPFLLRELKVFLDWATSVGYDVPINEDALLAVIEAQKIQAALDSPSSSVTPNQSDAALGAETRQRYRDFAGKNQERHDARAVEHQRWRDAADEIQRTRRKEASGRMLARLVKEQLDLPDAESTIRAGLAKSKVVK
jgi:hypothetical protein